MSNDLAVAAVTLTLRSILQDQVGPDPNGDPEADAMNLQKQFVVSVLPVGEVRKKHSNGENVVNLFLYRTDVNAAWRNRPLPSRSRPGENGTPPLALNLEYLLTVFGEDDKDEPAHFFLGRAMRVLHDLAMLPRQDLRAALAASRVHDQIERVTITPRSMSIEEISKLWSVLQGPYRLSTAYLVTVLLIESRTDLRSPQPVLFRGPADSGVVAAASPSPTLLSATPATNFPAVRLGETLLVAGRHLATGVLTARVRSQRVTTPIELAVIPENASRVQVALPDPGTPGTSARWPAGFYSLALAVTMPDPPSWTTNEVPFAVAPSITIDPVVNALSNTPLDITIRVHPQIVEGQETIVLWGARQIAPTSVTTPGPDGPTTVVFRVTAVAGLYLVRLRVDGVDSIPIRTVNGTMEFDPAQRVEVQDP